MVVPQVEQGELVVELEHVTELYSVRWHQFVVGQIQFSQNLVHFDGGHYRTTQA